MTAAIALQQAVARLREHKVPGLGLRVGVAVGDVTEEDGDVFGPAVVTASRLCSAAGEHQILATDMVRMLAGDRGGHHYEAVGELILKGIAEPVPACTIRVDADGRASGRCPAALAATPAELVVGRGDGARRAERCRSRRRARVSVGRCSSPVSRGWARPAWWRRWPAAPTTRVRWCSSVAARKTWRWPTSPSPRPCGPGWPASTPRWWRPMWRSTVARSAASSRPSRRPSPSGPSPRLEQARLFDAVTDLLHRAAEDRPVVLVLDDLHWAAPSTIALLRHLLGADPDHRLCVLGTYRDTEVDRSHALGGLLADIHRSSSGVERLALRGLDGQGIEELLAAVSGDELDDDGRALAAALAERTDGNPFFANQVLRHLAERGVLVQDGGRWTVSGSLDDVDLPEGVLDVVGRRLSRLSPAANQALAVAALGGLEFGVRVLCEVPDAGTPDAVVDGLDEAVRARLLVETGPGRFAFTHAIVRDALTRELTVAKRARLHRALGEAILAVYARRARRCPSPSWPTTSPRPRCSATPPPRPDGRPPPPAAAADQADHRGAIAVLERALAVIETVEPVDQAARFEVAAALAERHYALTETDAASVGSAADAARRLRSGARMLRIAMARYDRGSGVDRSGGDRAVRGSAPAPRPRGGTAARPRRRITRLASVAPGRSPGSPTTSRRRTSCSPTSRRARPRSPPRFAAGSSRPPWAFPAPRTGSACATRPWPSRPRPRTRGGPSSPPASTSPVCSSMCRGHSLMALGRRAEFETNLAQVMELGETTGNTCRSSAWPTAASPSWRCSTGASTTCPPAPTGCSKRHPTRKPPPLATSGCWGPLPSRRAAPLSCFR